MPGRNGHASPSDASAAQSQPQDAVGGVPRPASPGARRLAAAPLQPAAADDPAATDLHCRPDNPGGRPEPGAGAAPPACREASGASPSFDQRVYGAVALIPHGRLATYGQIAELIGAWGCARQVGWALRRLPLPSPIPWQRVVNAAGRIAMTPSREGSDWIQAELLRQEGIPVDAMGRLPLARFRWRPDPPQAAIPADGIPADGIPPPHDPRLR